MGFQNGHFTTDTSSVTTGVGGINYLSANSDFEGGVQGYNTYADAAGSSPVDGTGGSPSVTISQTASSPLRGTSSGLFTKGASNLQGQGFSYDFTIDNADKAKILQVTADYAIASGTYADGDLTVYVYDVTNALVIQPAGYSINKLTTDLPGKINATFQTASNSTSYRLIFHVASTSASAYTVKLDNVVVGPQVVEYGAPVTDWTSYTPTLTGFGTVSNLSAFYRRVGDSLEFTGSWTNGGSISGNESISLPSGLSIDASKFPSSANGVVVGFGAENPTGSSLNLFSSNYAETVFYDGSTTSAVFATNTITSGAYVKQPGSASRVGNYFFRVPISGWSSSVVMSNDTDTRVVAAIIGGTPQSSYTADTAIKWPTVSKDTHGAYNASTGQYTAPMSGYYQVGASANTNMAAGNNFQVYVNGSLVSPYLMVSSPSNGLLAGSGVLVYASAGQTIDVRASANWSAISASNEGLTINRLSGPSAIAASESVNAKYWATAGTTSTTSVPIEFATKVYDTHGAVSASPFKFTAPVKGIYSISAYIASSSGTNATYIQLYKNGSLYENMSWISNVATANLHSSVSSIQLIAGDYIDIRCGTSTAVAGNATQSNVASSHIEINKVGN